MGWTSVDWIEGKKGFVMRFELGRPWVSSTGLRPREKGVNLWMLVEGTCQGVERFSWAMLAKWVRAMGLLPSRFSSRFVKTLLFHPHNLFYRYFWKPFLCHLKWWYITHLTCKGISPFFMPALQGSSKNKLSHISWYSIWGKPFPVPPFWVLIGQQIKNSKPLA